MLKVRIGETHPDSLSSYAITAGLDAGILKKTVGEGNPPDFFHRTCIQKHLDCVNSVESGSFHHYRSCIRERYPLSIRGVGRSICVEGILDADPLDRLAALHELHQ